MILKSCEVTMAIPSFLIKHPT